MQWTRIAAWILFLGVAIGAFGAHGLEDRIPADRLDTFETGVKYHFYHGLGLLLLGAIGDRLAARRVRLVGMLFVGGIAIFSGTLYALAITGIGWLGAITPIGGLSFLAGWVALATAPSSEAARQA